MRKLSELATKAVVRSIVGWVRKRISADYGRGAMISIGSVAGEVDLAQEPLLMVLQFANHGDVGMFETAKYALAKQMLLEK